MVYQTRRSISQGVRLVFLARKLDFHLKVPHGELQRSCNSFIPISVVRKELRRLMAAGIIISSLMIKQKCVGFIFMKFKCEVAGIFMKFKAWIENQSGCKTHVIRLNNGTEYISDRFNSFYEEAGIEHQLTVPYSPQQNGVSERKNRTIMDISRCLLQEKNQPKKFWAEAANTTVYLLNRQPTRAVEGKTPFKAWYGFKPDLKNLKIFGCICFSYVPQVKRDKLDKKADLGIFIGYNLLSKAYRIFQP